MNSLFELIPADFPFLGGQPAWVMLIAVLAGMAAMIVINNFYFAWLRRRWPGLVRPRSTLAILAFCAAFIGLVLAVTPPSEIRKVLQPPAAPTLQPSAPAPFLPHPN